MTVPRFNGPDDFRDDVIGRHVPAMRNKHDVGQKEHGGLLYEYSIKFLLRESLNENIDQTWYLRGLEHRMDLVVEALTSASVADTAAEKDAFIGVALTVIVGRE